MPTTYRPAHEDHPDLPDLLARVISGWHPNLATAKVIIGISMAYNPDGAAVKAHGYAAYAQIKIISDKDRVFKNVDAEMTIDEREWESMGAKSRLALLDHECSHVQLVEMKGKEKQRAMNEAAEAGENTLARWWSLDQHGRPKLKSIKGDWNGSDGFKAVVMRHGEHAIEFLNAGWVQAAAVVAEEKGRENRPTDLIEFLDWIEEENLKLKRKRTEKPAVKDAGSAGHEGMTIKIAGRRA